MRGMFTAGVIDVWMEHGITFDGAIGVSAGATFGCNLKSLQPGRTIRYNKRYCRDWRYCSFRSLLVTGDLYGREFCYDELPKKLDPFDTDTFMNNPMRFYVVATDVETGEAVYKETKKGTGLDMEWFRASASMPVLSRPVLIGGRGYLDGGCTDSIPVKYFESIGYEKNIVLLTQPKGYRKNEKNPLMPALKALLHKYPALQDAMEHRAERYNETVRELEKRQKEGDENLLVIYPPEELNIGKMEKNPDELERVYRIGRRTAERMLDQVREFLEK